MDLTKPWFLRYEASISLKDRLKLLLLIKSAGIDIWQDQEKEVMSEMFICLIYEDIPEVVVGYTVIPGRVRNYQHITYEELVSALTNKIKRAKNE